MKIGNQPNKIEFMAILRGFPPSNTISPTTYIPDIVDTPIKLSNLEPEEKFRTKTGAEYMRLSNDFLGPRGICYKSSTTDYGEKPGDVYGFDPDVEVIWLRKIYRNQVGHAADCCQKCGTKLVCDEFSKTYGDWCPNENCG